MLALAAAPHALGDVFVPADPAAPRALGSVRCVTGAGDVLVYQRDERGGPFPPTAAELDAGPAQRYTLAHQHRLSSCPTAAAAADGTAVAGFVAAPGASAVPRIAVRPSGGRFGGPLSVALPGASALTPAVAAAPGGWVAAALVQATRAHRSEVAARVVAPDGTPRNVVIDAGTASATEYSPPRVGIDSSGAATVAWTRWSSTGERLSDERVRVARSAPGATAWEPTRELGGGRRLADAPTAPTHVGLAVAPAGRVLAAWSTASGVSAVEGAAAGLGPATALASGAGIASPEVALADDGAAVVAYSQSDDPAAIFVVHRAAGGPWSAARLSGAPAHEGGDPPEGRPIIEDRAVSVPTALASDGRAIVAWRVRETVSVTNRVVAAAGRAGGAWEPVLALSVPTRDTVGTPSAFLGAAGDPRVAWIEDSLGPRGRLRADRLVADVDAGPADTAAPVLTVALPQTLRVSRRGRVAPLRLKVRCSERCDVRGELGDAIAHRAIAVGGAALLRFGPTVLVDPGVRHLRLRVMAADRAGNVTVRSRLVAVARR